MSQAILFSGIQPSGELILGNYLGAIHQWLAMQDDHQCFFSIVDLHSLTVRQDPKVLREHCYQTLALYLACGIDPKRHTIFLQSQVPAHSELMWMLSCLTGMGELNRMTQFKEKSERHSDNINAGLFTYPALMAADILLYQTEQVPVGEDQKQHLELARQLAQRFNHHYGETFTIPEPIIPTHGARIMSLQDPLKKMSKSDDVDANVIRLLDPPARIQKKCKRAVTDSLNQIVFDRAQQPGVANLLTMLSVCTGKTMKELETHYQGQGYGQLKGDTADAVVTLLEPIQIQYQALIDDKKHLDEIFHEGQAKAMQAAQATLEKAKAAMGLIA